MQKATKVMDLLKRVAVFSAGYIAVELAGIFHTLGGKSRCASAAETVPQGRDKGTKGQTLMVQLESEEKFELDCLWWTIGRDFKGAENLVLEELGFKLDEKGNVAVDEHHEIGVPVKLQLPLPAGCRTVSSPEKFKRQTLSREDIPTVVVSHVLSSLSHHLRTMKATLGTRASTCNEAGRHLVGLPKSAIELLLCVDLSELFSCLGINVLADDELDAPDDLDDSPAGNNSEDLDALGDRDGDTEMLDASQRDQVGDQEDGTSSSEQDITASNSPHRCRTKRYGDWHKSQGPASLANAVSAPPQCMRSSHLAALLLWALLTNP
ncbi:hypothetical protein C8T65DRAFT_739790 [Cerioporus squamosus]|nr:hypothetical protein C8T65DRAFT_739790 [Cerioporus squamosus]